MRCYVVAVGTLGPLQVPFVAFCTLPLRLRTTILAFAVAVNLDFGIWKSSGGGLPKAGAKKNMENNKNIELKEKTKGGIK